MNICGTRDPLCHNGGTCENTKPDEYLCRCPEGFSGTDCEVVDNVCATAPCLHGGTCTVTTTVVTNGISGSIGGGGSFNCSCPPGWTGDTCQISKSFFFFLTLLSIILTRRCLLYTNSFEFSKEKNVKNKIKNKMETKKYQVGGENK